MIRNLLLLFLMVSISAYSASKKKNVRKLQDKVSRYSAEINKLGASIKSIEKELGKTNTSYMEKTRRLKDLDEKINTLKDKLSLSAKTISDSFKKSKKVLNQYLLETIDQNNSDQLIKRKIYLKVLQAKINNLRASQKESQNLLLTINDYEENLKQTRITEDTLYNVIVDLENKKKSLGQNYITKLENKNEVEEQLELAIARLKVKKKKTRKRISHSNVSIGKPFENPISFFTSRKGSKKGVTYKYNKVSPITVSKKGKVLYAGELASYGKVIIVDHGKDIRSVIVGDFSIKIKKGDMIAARSILGYANVDPGLSKSLYYEIRKNNKVQNTIKLLKLKKYKRITNETLKFSTGVMLCFK